MSTLVPRCGTIWYGGESRVDAATVTWDGQVNAGNIRLSTGRSGHADGPLSKAGREPGRPQMTRRRDRPWWCLGEPTGELMET